MVALLLSTLALILSVTSQFVDRPHIVYIMADDLGWNDVSFHGSNQILTPNIDALAYNGMILNQHYVQPTCTPSRAALMTGKYPIYTGLQGYPLSIGDTRTLPAGKILPGHLKDLGYVTRLVGKWHLGYSSLNATPTHRGFDSHLGHWTGFTSYYDYIHEGLMKIKASRNSDYK
ncbi:arylsulfatase B-like [Ctenocephalides felis]|uniref:arylsulfatase B-like n=1 Tax=Ctenocephalides felis TaxID=7515 RepID=UPI000E6E4328|nr:arylsulfatase B-like [Ctenocephalides felis]